MRKGGDSGVLLSHQLVRNDRSRYIPRASSSRCLILSHLILSSTRGKYAGNEKQARLYAPYMHTLPFPSPLQKT